MNAAVPPEEPDVSHLPPRAVRPARRRRRPAAVLALVAVGATAWTLAAAAPTSAATTTAVIRSAHFSPDTAGVDVYLQRVSGGSLTLWIAGETYGQVSSWQRLPAGVYAVSMRPHGAAPSTPAAVTWTLDARAGRSYTAAAIGRHAALQAVVLAGDDAPVAADAGRVRLVQAASQTLVSVEANGGMSLGSDLAFGTVSSYRSVPAGTWDVRATSTGPTPAGSATAKVAVPAGSSSTVVVVDTPSGRLGVLSFVDSSATGTAPVGSVDAGAGGTAPDPTPAVLVAIGAGAMALAVSGVAVVGGRRRRSPLAATRRG